MPYKKSAERLALAIGKKRPMNPGELNYLITKLCIEYGENHHIKYQTINDILGALDGAKLEFYARIARPYEDRKIKENGDVYSTGEDLI